MKTKTGKREKSAIHKFDIKTARDLLLGESKFITELLDKQNFPVPGNNDSDIVRGSSDKTFGVHSKKKAKLLAAQSKGATRAKSLEELHDKLQAMRGKKLGYRDKLLKKGLKNKVIKKQKKDERKGRKNLSRTKPDYGSEFVNRPKPLKPIYNSEGKMVFSRFDFSESGYKNEVMEKKGRDERDPHKMLKKIEKQNEKLKDLEATGEIGKLTEIREKIAWNRALSKSEGVKVKDNPELLKKTIKKEIQQKQKSKRKWDARTEGMKNRRDEKQKKRMENIEARKKQVKINKLKKAAKKGRIIPGF
ncbi:hypothetical protein B7P43_G04401 [Cryptotermes secundus]|uniref:Ribosomal RNA-processing protein 14/surfeit locus protein 6 C-terminal domain-containing protein n=2 Tax=Cryptotermes secundus TaxID=105785 RepID=A0A2J7PZW9_9NEOP|nr:surfeit locus protein 6 homolog [Cryptotermes secundus]PNF21877.1 hypothetical protein B7P43_G04401 [Cryptotermes secundus]